MKKLTKKSKIIFAAISIIFTATIIFSLIFVFANSIALKKASKNLSTYAIDATVSDDYKISAKQTIKYVNNTQNNLKEICLHLYPRAFREDAKIKPYTNLNKASCFPNGESYGDILISVVNINNNSANFEFLGEDEDILTINLEEELQPNKVATIYLEYEVTLANCTHRLGYYKNVINIANWYPIVSFYNNGWINNPYYSTGDPFVSDCANYNINISYPKEYMCFSSGDTISSSEGNSQMKAMVIRDFAIVLIKDAEIKEAFAGDTRVTYVGYSGDKNIDESLDIVVKATNYFSNKFMKYPYESLTVVKSAFLQGGMEYPNMVIISDSIDDTEEYKKVIVHEIAHQWWYGIVGNNQVTEAFLDESLAEYSTCLFYEDHPEYNQSYSELVKDATASYLLYVDVISSLNGKVNTSMASAVNNYNSEYEYTYMIYVKGVIMFDSLRDVVGKERLVKALSSYAKRYCYKVASRNDFVDSMKDFCHKDLDNFFDGWLDGKSIVSLTN